ncbi:MAG: DUF1622 domain-containing protein [Proteobacteria bacterium]|nr:DUF1622 domain-containing protein [Pseudomonadota bacterium]
MDGLIKRYTFYFSDIVEGCAILIITMAALQAMAHCLRLFIARPPAPEERKTEVRLMFGRWLSVALEFELATDILRTAVAPSWDEIGKLAAIAALRTLLNYFLEREIRASERPSRISADSRT